MEELGAVSTLIICIRVLSSLPHTTQPQDTKSKLGSDATPCDGARGLSWARRRTVLTLGHSAKTGPSSQHALRGENQASSQTQKSNPNPHAGSPSPNLAPRLHLLQLAALRYLLCRRDRLTCASVSITDSDSDSGAMHFADIASHFCSCWLTVRDFQGAPESSLDKRLTCSRISKGLFLLELQRNGLHWRRRNNLQDHSLLWIHLRK